MASIHTQTDQAKAKSNELLDILAETDHAPAQLAQQKQLIADLQTELAASDKRVAEASAHLASQLKSQEKSRTSLLRRLPPKAHNQGENYSEKGLKEELEYLSALQASSSEKQTNQTLTQQLFAAQTPLSHLESLAARHAQAQHALDALYDPTGTNPPAYSAAQKLPEEEDATKQLTTAAAAYHEVQTTAAAEAIAVPLLRDALRSMVSVLNAMRDATAAKIFADRGVPGKKPEETALTRAETQLSAARLAVTQARKRSACVPDMPVIDIERERLMRLMYSGNLDGEAGKRGVEEAAGRVKSAADAVDRMVTEAVARCREMDPLVRRRGEELRGARGELQRVRRAAFESRSLGERAG
ncbi:hypothetical protein B0T22DRAFT_449611 [Podospora appendiculata]|uniref:Uncharacterized protein n=1 Tax=Podospora appendiculata TaxID=314037 RepID=A0AAE0XH65_9PEZI|nr:hypothetical protein B0T22DRAFT_449611 [Podospora appendiculata]